MHPEAFFGALSQCESINAIDNEEREKEEGTSQFSLTFPCSSLAFLFCLHPFYTEASQMLSLISTF